MSRDRYQLQCQVSSLMYIIILILIDMLTRGH